MLFSFFLKRWPEWSLIKQSLPVLDGNHVPGNGTSSVDSIQPLASSLLREVAQGCYIRCSCWLEGQNMQWDLRWGAPNPGGSNEMRGDLDQKGCPQTLTLKLILEEWFRVCQTQKSQVGAKRSLLSKKWLISSLMSLQCSVYLGRHLASEGAGAGSVTYSNVWPRSLILSCGQWEAMESSSLGKCHDQMCILGKSNGKGLSFILWKSSSQMPFTLTQLPRGGALLCA